MPIACFLINGDRGLCSSYLKTWVGNFLTGLSLNSIHRVHIYVFLFNTVSRVISENVCVCVWVFAFLEAN